MRKSMAFCVMVGLALVPLAACSKKDDAAQEMPPAVGSKEAKQAVAVAPAAAPAAPTPAPQQAPAAAQKAPAVVYNPLAQAGQVAGSIARPTNAYTTVVERHFVCKNETTFTAKFMHNPNQVQITFPGRVPVTLPQEYSPTGFVYRTTHYHLIGKGRLAQWTLVGRPPVDCEVK